MGGIPVPEERIMHRFYAEQTDEGVFLSPEDSHHALRVLRLHTGSRIEAFLSEERWSAVLSDVNESRIRLQLCSSLPSTESRLRVTLFQGLPKADKMEMIVQKATELGVDRIVPVRMSRCVVRLDDREAGKKVERWQKIVREACKQSGRSQIPEVTYPVSLNELCQLLQSLEASVVPWEDADVLGPAGFAASHTGISSLGIVIGPEGGIDPDEIRQMESSGCVPVTLGPRILRTETAGLAAISAIMALYGEMEVV